MNCKHLSLLLMAVLLTLPALAVRLAGVPLDAPLMALLSGTAILGASCLLLWACDAAQADISTTLALAIVALIAVLPEYAVDMYFTWQAGQNPAGNYAHYAIANMTGANRLLIGVAWGVVAVLSYCRCRRDIRLESERRTELLFLGLATLYAFVIPLKGTLAWYDGLVFLGLYVWYIALASKRPTSDCHAEGPAELLLGLPKAKRRLATTTLFVFAGGTILANAQPFCEGLVHTGKVLGINEFLLVQWLAPIASEAPEFIVAMVFAWRGQASLALGSLLSSKLNQWTLLVGMIPGVFAAAHGKLSPPMPMNQFQMHEILLTAAQSLLAVVLLASMRLSMSGALLLFGLFVGQLATRAIAEQFPKVALGMSPQQIHLFFSMLYLTAAAALFLQRPGRLVSLRRGIRVQTEAGHEQAAHRTAGACTCEDQNTAGGDAADDEPLRTPQCAQCKWRLAALAHRRPRITSGTTRSPER